VVHRLLVAVVLVVTGCARGPVRSSAPSGGETRSASSADVVRSIDPWAFGNAKGLLIRTAHYRLYTTERDAVILSRMPVFLEAALEHYRSALGLLPGPSIRLDTYLMDNRTQWVHLTQMLVPARADDYLRIERGGFAVNGIGVYFDLGLYDTHAIAAHEGWHQYVQRSFVDPIPVWLNEGIAAYMEGFRWAGDVPVFRPWANVERFDQLRNAQATGSLMHLRELLNTTPQQLGKDGGLRALTYYAQVWALVHFLHEGENGQHLPILRQLLQDAASGNLLRVLRLRLDDDAVRVRASVGDTIFRAYFGEDVDRMNDAYRAFVVEMVRPGARDVLIRGVSPMLEETP
jgi:uncharacterized protein DUF1570